MRKLPWQDVEVKDYVICCMINIWNVKYNSIHCVANLLAGLVLYQEDVGIHVVDGVLEDIRLGMEVNSILPKLYSSPSAERKTVKPACLKESLDSGFLMLFYLSCLLYIGLVKKQHPTKTKLQRLLGQLFCPPDDTECIQLIPSYCSQIHAASSNFRESSIF